jgi:hypothetical protein
MIGYETIGFRWIHGCAFSNAAEADITDDSSLNLPIICIPIGSPSDENPQGILAAGFPIMLMGLSMRKIPPERIY